MSFPPGFKDSKVPLNQAERPQIQNGDQVRQERIAQSVALNNALEMVRAISSMPESLNQFTNRDDYAQWLVNIKNIEYADNCKKLGIVPEIPF